MNGQMKYIITVLKLSPISLGFNPTSFQSSPGLSFEAKCKTFLVKMSFIWMRIKKNHFKLIFETKGLSKLRNGLF